MDTNDLLKDLESLFRNVFKDESIILTSSTTANDIEEWTSLTNMLLINEIENKYNIKFKFREIIKLKDVGELCDAIILKMK